MKLRILGKRSARAERWLAFLGVAAVLMGSGLALALTLPQASPGLSSNANYSHQLSAEYVSLVKSANQFEASQKRAHSQIVSSHDIELMLSRVQVDMASSQFRQAKTDMASLRTSLSNWNLELRGGTGPAVAQGPGVGKFIPILIYHYTPPNFEQQLVYLEQHAYTVIDMDQAIAGMHGAPLPAKPVVITYDDGFSNQMQAFDILKRHNMKATFYIISGGAQSLWCIGAGRRYNDPLQPKDGCGDAYLTWDQVRQLDHSGLVTIGGHTFNHRNLATLTPAEQTFEIADAKTYLEHELGHSIRHFAYPYGAYNATTIQIVRDAGYVSAVTTMSGDFQPAGSDFTLRRVRDTLTLP